jgi:hypothetical protein
LPCHSRGDNDETRFLQVVLLVYVYVLHCVLKICNEAIVEGMCRVVAKHAHGTWGLIFDIYTKERASLIIMRLIEPTSPCSLKAVHIYLSAKHYKNMN